MDTKLSAEEEDAAAGTGDGEGEAAAAAPEEAAAAAEAESSICMELDIVGAVCGCVSAVDRSGVRVRVRCLEETQLRVSTARV